MKVAIYGAGIYGKAFFKALQSNKIKVDMFIDQFTDKRYLDGVPIYKIEEVRNKNIKVYIATSLNNNEEIPTILKKNNYTNISSFKQSLCEIDNVLSFLIKTNILWMREKNVVNKYDVKKFYHLLKDEKSKKILDMIIAFRETLDMKYYVVPDDSSTQYLPSDIPIFQSINTLNLIDCGAFVGDTVHSFISLTQQHNIKVDTIISFEADSKNIEKLNQEIQHQKKLAPSTNFIVYPAGVWSKNKFLHFSNDGDSASKILGVANETTISIPVFSLDSTVKNMNINYIKMDIEGAELKALEGAKEIIRQQSPILAICLYHHPSHLWKIPLLINKMNPNYDMYIRVYGHLGLETVLYCVPKGYNNV